MVRHTQHDGPHVKAGKVVKGSDRRVIEADAKSAGARAQDAERQARRDNPDGTPSTRGGSNAQQVRNNGQGKERDTRR